MAEPVATVLFLERGGEVGGAERVLLDLAARADRARFRTLAVCLAAGRLPTRLAEAGTPTTVFPVGRLREVHRVAAAMAGLVRLAKSEGVDVIHANGTMMLLYAGPVARLAGCRLVWQVYDPQGTHGLARRCFVAVASRFRPDWTVFGTLEVEESHRRVFGRIRRASTILPGVDVAGLAATPGDRSVLPAGVPASAVVALALARYVPGKGIEDLIDAVARVGSAVPALHVVVCGGLPAAGYAESLERLVAEKGVADRFHLLGHVPEETARNLLASCDLLVHPATKEPFGLAVVEAMAAGKPVVAADAAGPSHTVLDGVTGILYPRGDSGRLAEALARLATDGGLRRQLGEAGRRRAEEFTIDRMVLAIEDVWTAVLAGASQRRRRPARARS